MSNIRSRTKTRALEAREKQSPNRSSLKGTAGGHPPEYQGLGNPQDYIRHLQGTIGNQALYRLITSGYFDSVSRNQGEPLEAGLKNRMEQSLGADFDEVRLHRDAHSANLATTLDAKAFTYRNNIYFNRDQSPPDTIEGENLVAHELVHVLQQRSSVSAEGSASDLAHLEISSAHDPAEAEADRIADTVTVAGNNGIKVPSVVSRTPKPMIQRRIAPRELSMEMVGKTFYYVDNQQPVLFIVTEWQNAKTTVKGRTVNPGAKPGSEFEIAKTRIHPYAKPVAGITLYHSGANSQGKAVEAVDRQIKELEAKESHYQLYNNMAEYNQELQRLLALKDKKQSVLNEQLIQETMYNLFDESIAKWTAYYNAKFQHRFKNDPLNPNFVKAMIYQESQMGTAGKHMYKTIVYPDLFMKTRFNVMQMIDSAAVAFMVFLEEIAPELLQKYQLHQLNSDLAKEKVKREQLQKKLENQTILPEEFKELLKLNDLSNYGHNWTTYMWKWRSESLKGAVLELLHRYDHSVNIHNRDALLKAYNAGKPFGYDFWIRLAIRWVFYKRMNEAPQSWAAAVRAYNGAGIQAAAYQAEVFDRATAANQANRKGLKYVPQR